MAIVAPLSFCIGVYNEEIILRSQLEKIKKGLDSLVGVNKYEIIIVDNGSTDKTPVILESIMDPVIKPIILQQKGFGLALREGIKRAKYNTIVLSAIDLPFGFEDLQLANNYWSDFDIIFGSKAHPKSIIFIPFKRRLMSFFYRSLLHLLFHITIGDTQGTIFLKKRSILPFLDYCDSENAFFTAQLAIYSHLYCLHIKEIPVFMKKEKNRPSRIHIIHDGTAMVRTMLKEFYRYRKIKQQLHF